MLDGFFSLKSWAVREFRYEGFWLSLEEGYGRQFGEKMTYSVGMTYGGGLLTGGFYGGLLGIRQGGATPKLFVNSVLNSCSRYGPALANQSAIITMPFGPNC